MSPCAFGFPPLENEGLVMKRLADSRQILVGQSCSARPVRSAGISLGVAPSPRAGSHPLHAEDTSWEFRDAGGRPRQRPFEPRYTTDDMDALRQAAEDGVGIVQLADYLVMDQIASGIARNRPAWIGRCRAESCTPFFPRAAGFRRQSAASSTFLQQNSGPDEHSRHT